jgi:large subunit ribosomal protein L30
MAKKAESSKGSALKITLTKGLVHKMDKHCKVVQGLGLRGYGSSVVHMDSPTIRGMVRKVQHLVTVEATNEQPQRKEYKHKKKEAAAQ